MRRTGNNMIMLLEVQNKLKKGEILTLVTNEYPKYIEDNIENVLIESIESNTGVIIGYNISLKRKSYEAK